MLARWPKEKKKIAIKNTWDAWLESLGYSEFFFLFAYFHGFNLSRIYSQLLSYQKSNATVDKYQHVCTLTLFVQLLIALI
jgi:hypothetical protein